jgi:filamentous hemagglutinin family protein
MHDAVNVRGSRYDEFDLCFRDGRALASAPSLIALSVAMALWAGVVPVAWASEALIVPNGQTNTQVSADAGGRLTVTPAQADRDGTSLNGYERFSVGAAGVDFDNTGVSARLIVNEVTGALPSRLEGEIAILGPRANFILANPNGIVADGVRFINTGAIALSTGRVELNEFYSSQDYLRRNILLHTSVGSIEVGAGGIVGAFTHLELIARAIRINGPITNEFDHDQASVRLIAGASTVEIDTSVSPVDELTPWAYYKAGEEQGEGILVDITALGSVRTGRIEILVTDKGAGVRHAGQAFATHGDFIVSNQGEVHLLENSRVEALGHAVIIAEVLNARFGARLEAQAGGLVLEAEAIDLAGSYLQGGAGVDVKTASLRAATVIDEGGEVSVATLASNGGGLKLKVDGAAVLDGADVLALGNIALDVKGDLDVGLGGGQGSRIVSLARQLTLEVGGALTNIGGLLQGYGEIAEAENEGETAAPEVIGPAVIIRAQGGFTNRTPDASALAVVFGEAGDVVIESAGDILNHTARIIANGDLRLSTPGIVYNLIEKIPGGNDEQLVEGRKSSRWLGLVPSSESSALVDFGGLVIEGQLAWLIADGNLDIKAHELRSIGGEIHANDGDLNIVVETVFENRALRTGQLKYTRSCFIGCQRRARSSVALNGGGMSASGTIRIQAPEQIINEGGNILAVGAIELASSLVSAQAIEGYLAVSQTRGLGKSYGRILRSDTGGVFGSGADLTISGDAVVVGGELLAQGEVLVGGERRDVSEPVRETLPGGLPGSGVFSFLLGD